jgi:LacI family transcriptional regulator
MSNVTIYDIAKKCNVSPSTVSKVLNNYQAIPQETKDKILKCIKAMNYIPNVGAKSLSKRTSRNVGVLAYFGMDISPFRYTLFTEILDAFQSEVNANNYDLLFISHNVDGRNGSFYQNCISRNVAGVILFGDYGNPEMQEVIGSKIPKVGFDYMGELMTGVFTDNYVEMKNLTKHLINLGHKHIVFVHGESNAITEERIRGFKDAIKEGGLEERADNLVETKYHDVESIKNITRNILHRISVPTAIMYPDDRSAMTGLSAIKEEGFRCPEDISVTGFDGIEASQIVSPHLTTAKQDAEKLGKTLAHKLIDLMEKKESNPEPIEVRGSIIVGESTGPINPDR